MIWLAIVIGLLIVCFAGVLLFGAPYLPTLKPQVTAALQLADLRPGQTLLELGCGDGRVLAAAARQGIHAVGYELNPLLATVAWLRTRRHRKRVKVIWGNFWQADWPPADAAFAFLLPRYMSKLDAKCGHYPHKPFRLVSFAFQIPGKQPAASARGVFLYDYR
ncbi:MAG TPA: methyltransferase domain-containing protein [Candidatus Saccharimonadales bacterium]|nr:methyltransferase domain-containing protein [Candidatus Saccharimonadales bacterium]